MKEKAYHYHVYVNEIALPLQADNLTKRQQLAYMAQQFASGMEQMVKKYPTQWFNYFDFWNQ
jgi:predicted LPLAT superfamily acyltransferase